jgi:hypothetical protein
MPKERAREGNVVELNAGKRERIDKGFKEPNEMLAERANAELSALDQLMTIINGRRRH